MRRSTCISIVACVGIAASAYAVYVESQLTEMPGYQAACDFNAWFSCTKVFKSKYGHILSYWGLVEKGGDWDYSDGALGLVLNSGYFLYPILRFIPYRQHLYFGVSIGACLFSLYFGSILAFVLKDFCVVCVTVYSCNVLHLIMSYREYQKPEPALVKRKKKKAE
eukprot:g2501.t1